MNIFTIGNGFIASHFDYDKINERLEPSNLQIKSVLKKYKPDVLINTIGFCGVPNIDQCEVEKERTIIANTVIPSILAIECWKLDIKLIHIGSGCIYCKESPNLISRHEALNIRIDSGWKETDPANPASFYSKTKYAADLAIGDMDNVAILRIRMPISDKNSPRNLITKLRRYNKVIDIPNSVTFTEDLVRCVDYFIKNDIVGVYHVTNSKPLSAAYIIKEYQKYFPDHKFEIINEEQLGKLTIAKRSNCLLDNSKLKFIGFTMGDSVELLEKLMYRYIGEKF